MATMTGSGITYADGLTQSTYALRYKGTTTATSTAATAAGTATDYINITSNFGGQGIAVVGFDYWKTYNNLDSYGNIASYWTQVRLNFLRVERRYNYGNFATVIVSHDSNGGAHAFSIKYYTLE